MTIQRGAWGQSRPGLHPRTGPGTLPPLPCLVFGTEGEKEKSWRLKLKKCIEHPPNSRPTLSPDQPQSNFIGQTSSPPGIAARGGPTVQDFECGGVR
ncbi:hypothetical protein DPEC_G00225640 [Dallia pectoralis]|uniref:Uncharacterized protein n=1 Tax=Dallia pectoralis TaxID=75939 RepID=A0ACC2G058_DALPE|nr:hypothetical protein DPEC_G00225640 [Dallia pectoralis]